jgi:hypothetical protein
MRLLHYLHPFSSACYNGWLIRMARWLCCLVNLGSPHTSSTMIARHVPHLGTCPCCADVDALCDLGLVPDAANDPGRLLTRLNNAINAYTGRALYTVRIYRYMICVFAETGSTGSLPLG